MSNFTRPRYYGATRKFHYQLNEETRRDNKEAERRLSVWLDRNHQRAIDLVGHEQFARDMESMWEAQEEKGEYGFYIRLEADVRKYAEFLDALDQAGYTDRQIQNLKDEIAEAQEEGKADRVFALRDILVRYITRPELAGMGAAR